VNEFVDLICREFPEKKIIYVDQWRATNRTTRGLHFTSVRNVTTHTMAEAALSDMWALSQCSVVFKTSSSFSAFAKVLNPSVRLLTVSASRLRPFFPEGVASNDYIGREKSTEATQILRRTMKRPHDFDNRSSRQLLSMLCRSSSCTPLQ